MRVDQAWASRLGDNMLHHDVHGIIGSRTHEAFGFICFGDFRFWGVALGVHLACSSFSLLDH